MSKSHDTELDKKFAEAESQHLSEEASIQAKLDEILMLLKDPKRAPVSATSELAMRDHRTAGRPRQARGGKTVPGAVQG